MATKYYHFGSERVAMRVGSTVYYLHGDHLGSAALTTWSSGAVKHQVRHYPFGEQRWQSGADVNPYGFTDQLEEPSFDLLDYNARYYDSVIGRFISADSVVPDYANPQALNRYSYVRGNPVRFADPSGHDGCLAEDRWCWEQEWWWKNRWYNAHGYQFNEDKRDWSSWGDISFADEQILLDTVGEAGIQFVGTWAFDDQMKSAARGIVRFGRRLHRGLGQLQKLLGGGAKIKHGSCFGRPCALPGTSTVRLINSADSWYLEATVVHELAHIIDWHSRIQIGTNYGFGSTSPIIGYFHNAWTGTPLTNYAASRNGPYPLSWDNWAEAVTVWVFGALDVNTGDFVTSYTWGEVQNIRQSELKYQMSRIDALLNGRY